MTGRCAQLEPVAPIENATLQRGAGGCKLPANRVHLGARGCTLALARSGVSAAYRAQNRAQLHSNARKITSILSPSWALS